MPERLPPHSHCINCEEPVGEDEVFCSDKCKLEYERKGKKDKRKMILYYVLVMAILAVVWIVASLR